MSIMDKLDALCPREKKSKEDEDKIICPSCKQEVKQLHPSGRCWACMHLSNVGSQTGDSDIVPKPGQSVGELAEKRLLKQPDVVEFDVAKKGVNDGTVEFVGVPVDLLDAILEKDVNDITEAEAMAVLKCRYRLKMNAEMAEHECNCCANKGVLKCAHPQDKHCDDWRPVAVETEKPETETETAWLIECCSESGDPKGMYLRGKPGCMSKYVWDWGTADQAIRFAREEDASAVARIIVAQDWGGTWTVNEHQWG